MNSSENIFSVQGNKYLASISSSFSATKLDIGISERVALMKKLNWLIKLKGDGNCISFDYCRMRFYGPELSYVRTVCLNLDTLETSFPDGKGDVWVHPLGTFLSIMQTPTHGILQLDFRLTKSKTQTWGYNIPEESGLVRSSGDVQLNAPCDSVSSLERSTPSPSPSPSMSPFLVPQEDTRLKEQKWAFQPAEHANYFTRMVHLMLSRGPELREVFCILDRGNKGYLNIADLEAAVKDIENPEIKCQFTPLAIVRMVADADPVNIDRVRFSDFFTFLVFPIGDEQLSIDQYLLVWMRMAQFRIDDQIQTLMNVGNTGDELAGHMSLASDANSACRVRSGRQLLSQNWQDEQVETCNISSPIAPKKYRRKSQIGVTMALKEIEQHSEHVQSPAVNAPKSCAATMSVLEIREYLAKASADAQSDITIDAVQGDQSRELMATKLASLLTSSSSEPKLVPPILEGSREPISSTREQSSPASEEPRTAADVEVDYLRRGTVAQLKILKIKAAERAIATAAATAKAKSAIRIVQHAEDMKMPKLVTGETLVNRCTECVLALCAGKTLQEVKHDATLCRRGSIYLTSFRLCFVADRTLTAAEEGVPILTNFLETSLGSIMRIEFQQDESHGFHVGVECKDHRSIHISFPQEKGTTFAELFAGVIHRYAFWESVTKSHAFTAAAAFKNTDKFSENNEYYGKSDRKQSDPRSSQRNGQSVSNFDGWKAFIPEEEFARQGLLRDRPRASTIRASAGDRFDTTSLSTPSLSLSFRPRGLSRVASKDADRMWEQVDSASSAASTSNGPWRLWKDDYTLVQSYPSAFLVPSELSDEEVAHAAHYRSAHRMPAVTWGAPNGAVLARSSQPMSGITHSRSLADKLLLNILRTKGSLHSEQEQERPSKFYIIDCRSKLAANANAALGKGVEDDKKLVRTRVIFCGIANIHTMRESYAALGKLLTPGCSIAHRMIQLPVSLLSSIRRGLGWTGLMGRSNSEATHENRESLHIGEEDEALGELHRHQAAGNSAHFKGADLDPNADAEEMHHHLSVDFGARLEETGWLNHVRTVLSSAVMVATKLHKEQSSVLVHCSDGWDRTAQVCATAQLLLDPFYRTLQGFFVLIEKDWLGFGHKFQSRTGHGINFSKGNDHQLKEVSPVFLQWLDVVWQVMVQFPQQFEYNDKLLIFIADSLHACNSGTFLGNSEWERRCQLQCDTKTSSLWTIVMGSKNAFLNPAFQQCPYPLWPNSKHVYLWERLHCRYIAEYHPRTQTGCIWNDEGCLGRFTSDDNRSKVTVASAEKHDTCLDRDEVFDPIPAAA